MLANSSAAVYRRGVRARLSLVNLQRGSHSGSNSGNDDINPDFINRNPRNMELLRIGRKPQGYALDTPSNHYWYKLIFEPTNKNTMGRVVHHTGATVVTASTKEWAIKQHLYSNTDVSAAGNIGRVLAQRCLESGISELHTDLKISEDSSEKIKAFMMAMKEGGVQMTEPSYIKASEMYKWSRYLPTLPWEILEEEVLLEDKDTNKNEESKDVKTK